ncbi:MAG: Rnf-Nqr domain containing protein [Bacilli bacterium]|nr:Rnf-Nqr domain containing protein [Bacilli bacterium]MDD4283164.1 Rnf-Nqr domain containing protein [Bacilli bacterium]MDD4718508.1 Rnf-Nqr domain containing protein [Bacilli bacterium]
MTLFQLFMTSMLSENIILTKFLGICPFIGTSKRETSAVGMGVSVTIIMLLSSIITYLIYNYILVPTETTYLRTLMFILVISSTVQMLEMIIKKYFSKLNKLLGLFLPLIATNCAILGTTLLNVNNDYTFIEMLVFTLGSGLGFALIIFIFSTIRERMEYARIPKCFKGAPIALITASIMSLVFSRYFG